MKHNFSENMKIINLLILLKESEKEMQTIIFVVYLYIIVNLLNFFA